MSWETLILGKAQNQFVQVKLCSRIESAQVLTFREKQVLQLVYEGQSCKQIGRRLGISDRTAEVHRAHAMLKLQQPNVVHLIRWIAGDPTDQALRP
tara:strand:- start:19849 stop:20136 length:288 start_codon:yes stop_codon:yes gene_type:complete